MALHSDQQSPLLRTHWTDSLHWLSLWGPRSILPEATVPGPPPAPACKLMAPSLQAPAWEAVVPTVLSQPLAVGGVALSPSLPSRAKHSAWSEAPPATPVRPHPSQEVSHPVLVSGSQDTRTDSRISAPFSLAPFA